MPNPVLDYQSGIVCPKCGRPGSKPVSFTWWGGVLGPKLFHHVKCLGCGCAYNGKTGRSNTVAIIIYSVVVAVITLLLLFFVLSR